MKLKTALKKLGISENEVYSFVVDVDGKKIRVVKDKDGEYWREYPSGVKYMGYLKPSDILVWLSIDYPASRPFDIIAINGRKL